MSFDYTINIKLLNENMPDILISKYAILEEGYVEGNAITKSDIENNEIKGTLKYDNKTTNFTFKPFTVRVFFEWFEGENEQMDNEADTQIGIDATNNNTKLQIEASIKFEQSLNETTEEPQEETIDEQTDEVIEETTE